MKASQALPASLGLPVTLFTRKVQAFPIKSRHKRERAKRGDREEEGGEEEGEMADMPLAGFRNCATELRIEPIQTAEI